MAATRKTPEKKLSPKKRKRAAPKRAGPPPSPAPVAPLSPTRPATGPAVARDLARWFATARRDLPWRGAPGAARDPYQVWISEIMLQQTTVATAVPYFRRFMDRWPRVSDLAAAALDDVLHAWQGLGYYARARNLHRAARTVAETRGGAFPDTEEGLRTLPGVGPYTAAAIAAIAFGRRAVVVDGNVERVVARLFAVTEPLPAAKPRLRDLAGSLTPAAGAGDFAEAMMDLGATVCTVRRPACPRCPLRATCAARAAGIEHALPARAARAKKPLRRGRVFWCVDAPGRVLMRKRPEKGLLGGLMEFWSSDFSAPGARPPADPDRDPDAPCPGPWRGTGVEVRHVFTHFDLRLEIVAGAASARDVARLERAGGVFVHPEDFHRAALPTAMAKVAAAMAKAGR